MYCNHEEVYRGTIFKQTSTASLTVIMGNPYEETKKTHENYQSD
jgi:hypothetical protein